MRSINDLLNEYGESHQNSTNKTIHWVCVPSIFFSVIGLLYCIKLPFNVFNIQLNAAFVVVVLVLFYYLNLSISLAIGMFLFSLLCLCVAYFVERSNVLPLWLFSIIVFVVAWVGQFYGHKIEGKKPSFLKDIQFLIIGPAWLMSFIYKKMGVKL